MIDLEIKNYVNSISADFDRISSDSIATNREGIGLDTFLSTDTTLEHFDEYGWRPKFFNLSSTDSSESLLSKANAIAKEKIRLYDYELTGTKRSALERIMERARKAFV